MIIDSSTHSMDDSVRSTTFLTGSGVKPAPRSEAARPGDTDSGTDPGEGFTRIGWIFGGLADDFRRRAKFADSDYTDSFNRKTISAAAFMFFATIFSTIALGVHLQSSYDGMYIGVSEYLLMNGLAGSVFALASPQPLMVLRPTGPITLILENLIAVSKSYNVNFWHLHAFCGLFAGFYLVVVSSFELSRFTKYLTRFTHEIFACYVCSIYVYSGVKDTVEAFLGQDTEAGEINVQNATAGSAWMMAALAAATVLLCAGMSSLSATPEQSASWIAHPLVTRYIPSANVRYIIADNAVTIAVICCTVVSYIPSLFGANVFVERVALPEYSFPPEPSAPGFSNDGRDGWLVNVSEDSSGILYTMTLASSISLPIAFFFYIDQNLSSLLSQSPHMAGMRKGVYMHGPMFIIAICNMIGPIFGLPFVTASLPHSPQLVEALTDPSHLGGKAHCHEGRGAPILIYFFILLAAVVPFFSPLIRSIPLGAARGVLIFVGIAGITHTQIYSRITSLILRRQWPQSSDFDCRVAFYTTIQLAILSMFWILNLSPSPAGLCVAFVVAGLAPLRLLVLPKLFSESELAILDAGYS